MSDQTDVDTALDDIFSQLANNTRVQGIIKQSDVHVEEEDMGRFAIDSSAELVRKVLGIVDDIKDRTCASNDPEDIQALASTLKSASAAIDSFNKIYIANERNKVSRELKKADIESRTNINTSNNQTKLLLSREDVMKQLFEQAERPADTDEVIDV